MKVSVVREGASGKRVGFSLATNEVFGSGDKRKAKTEYHKIVAWGRNAEVCDQYLVKGRQISVIGKIRTRAYKDSDDTKRWITEIQADEIIFLGKKGDVAESEPEPEEEEENPF